MRKILICGLPGSGKTTLARLLQKRIPDSILLDGDAIRYATGNNDFTYDGRLTQARTMRDLANNLLGQGHHIIAAFVAPTNELREIFRADYTIWLDTIVASSYQDTNRLWQDLPHWGYRIHSLDWSEVMMETILLQAGLSGRSP